MPQYLEGQSLSANEISSTYLNERLRYNYFLLKNKRLPSWNSTSGFDVDHFAVICVFFCIRLPHFVQIGAPTAEIWRHVHFSRWRPRPLNTTSGFVFVDLIAFGRSISYQPTKFRRQISIHGWDITTSVFGKQTTAIRHIGILLPVSISTISL